MTADKYDVSENCLYVDWFRRDRWLEEIVSFKNSKRTIQHLLIDLERIMKEAEILRYEADNDNCRLGALKLAAYIRFKLIDVFDRLGLAQDILSRVEALEKAWKEDKEEKT